VDVLRDIHPTILAPWDNKADDPLNTRMNDRFAWAPVDGYGHYLREGDPRTLLREVLGEYTGGGTCAVIVAIASGVNRPRLPITSPFRRQSTREVIT
jgi:hypothetical protein